MSIPWARLRPLVLQLGALRTRRLFRHCLRREPPDEGSEIAPGETLTLLLAALLSRRRLLAEDQQDLLLEEMGSELAGFGATIAAALGKGRLPVCQLVVFDGRLARIAGEKRFLDLRTGTWIDRPPLPPIEALTLDLTALYTRAVVHLAAKAPPATQE